MMRRGSPGNPDRRRVGGVEAGTWPLLAYTQGARARDKAFSLAIRSAFGSFGRHSTICPPFRCRSTERIHIADHVYVGAGSWLETHEGGELILRSGVKLVGRVTIVAYGRVELDEDVLVAAGVYISDVSHTYSDPDLAIRRQGTTAPKPVHIGAGAWLAQNAVVLPGVTIGARAVVGANAVVRHDVPDGSVAVGVPARVIARKP